MAETAVNYYSVQSQLVENARAGGRGDTLIDHKDGGKLQVFHMNYTSPGGGIADGSVVSLGYLPNCKVIPHLTSLQSTDFGGATTIDIGLNEYKKNDGTVVAADADEFFNDLDVSGQAVNTTLAVDGVATAQDQGFDVEGFAEVIMTLAGGTMQAAARIDIWFVVARAN